MAYGRISNPERLLTYGMLVAGAMVFSFPFLWMVGTSVKVRREMAAAQLRLAPVAPRPRDRSPYIDSAEFDAPECPDGVPQAVWQAARPELASLLQQRVADWTPVAPGSDAPINISEEDRSAYETEMQKGLFEVLGARISDEARQAATDDQHRRLGSTAEPGAELDAEAVATGVDALRREVERLTDQQMLEETLDRCYRRAAVGECRLRTSDYRMHDVYTGTEWRVISGASRLEPRQERGVASQMLLLTLTPEAPKTCVELVPKLDDAAAEIDRVYVAYRGDAGWARLQFEVIRKGQLYRTAERQNLYERDWLEAELRWPSGRRRSMERRTYLQLRHVGAAPPDAPPFALRLRLTRNTWAGAWLDKISRNYRTVFREVPFARYIMTSLALSILCIVLNIFSCTLTAYAFARLEWPGRNLFFGVMLATMMIPPQVTMIPGFLIIRYLGWYNTLLPLWVFSAFGSAFFVFLLRQFFKSIPQDLEDAARIDGCGFLGIYWHVMLPLVKPTIATVAIYTFMGVWNNFMGPLIYVNDERLFPLALGLFKFNLRSGGDVGLMMAGSFLMTMPILVLFFFLQRYFIQGISLTGMKG